MNKTIHKKLISNPLPFQNKKRTRQITTKDQPFCSKRSAEIRKLREERGLAETKRTASRRNEKGQFS